LNHTNRSSLYSKGLPAAKALDGSPQIRSNHKLRLTSPPGAENANNTPRHYPQGKPHASQEAGEGILTARSVLVEKL
jgi:hypothetical protein